MNKKLLKGIHIYIYEYICIYIYVYIYIYSYTYIERDIHIYNIHREREIQTVSMVVMDCCKTWWSRGCWIKKTKMTAQLLRQKIRKITKKKSKITKESSCACILCRGWEGAASSSSFSSLEPIWNVCQDNVKKHLRKTQKKDFLYQHYGMQISCSHTCLNLVFVQVTFWRRSLVFSFTKRSRLSWSTLSQKVKFPISF